MFEGWDSELKQVQLQARTVRWKRNWNRIHYLCSLVLRTHSSTESAAAERWLGQEVWRIICFCRCCGEALSSMSMGMDLHYHAYQIWEI